MKATINITENRLTIEFLNKKIEVKTITKDAEAAEMDRFKLNLLNLDLV